MQLVIPHLHRLQVGVFNASRAEAADQVARGIEIHDAAQKTNIPHAVPPIKVKTRAFALVFVWEHLADYLRKKTRKLKSI